MFETLKEDLGELRRNRLMVNLWDFVVKTLLPSGFAIWFKYVFIDEGEAWLFGSPLAFAVYGIGVTALYVVTKVGQEQSQVLSQMGLRHILLSFRKLAAELGERADVALNVFDRRRPRDSEATIGLLTSLVDFKRTRRKFLEELFLAVSNRNVDLNQHYRVSLAEVEGEVLRLVDYANSENVQPRSCLDGTTFRRKQGTAGWAWELGEIFTVPDVDRFKQDRTAGKINLDYFVDMHRGHREVKSIVAIPVVIHSSTQPRIVAVVSIDADVTGAFQDSLVGKRRIRVKTYPYVRALEALYATRELLSLVEQADVREARAAETRGTIDRGGQPPRSHELTEASRTEAAAVETPREFR